MSDHVVLHLTYDPIEGRFLVDYLRHNGIDALFLGSQNARGIGMAQFMIQLRVEVPEAQLELAKDLMQAFFTEYQDSLADTPHELKTVPTRLHELKEELGLIHKSTKETAAEKETEAASDEAEVSETKAADESGSPAADDVKPPSDAG